MKRIFRGELGLIFAGLALFIPGVILGHFGFDILSLVLLTSALIITGFDVFVSAIRGLLRRDFLDEKFLMTILVQHFYQMIIFLIKNVGLHMRQILWVLWLLMMVQKKQY